MSISAKGVADDILLPLTGLLADYDVVIGLYDLRSGVRLPISGDTAPELYLTQHP